MVSTALLLQSGPKFRAEWNQKDRRIANRAALRGLEGVGLTETDTPEEGRITTIIRRQCTDDERKSVLERYLL